MKGYLDIRQSHKYRDGWAHLDEWENLGTWRVVRKYSNTGFYDEHGEPVETYDGAPDPDMFLIEVSTRDEVPHDVDDVKRSLMDTFTTSSCTHEHDCCGCVSSWVESVIQHPHDEDQFWVSVTYSRNI